MHLLIFRLISEGSHLTSQGLKNRKPYTRVTSILQGALPENQSEGPSICKWIMAETFNLNLLTDTARETWVPISLPSRFNIMQKEVTLYMKIPLFCLYEVPIIAKLFMIGFQEHTVPTPTFITVQFPPPTLLVSLPFTHLSL